MTIFLFDPGFWKLALAIPEIAIVFWAVRRAKRKYEGREEIVTDGWVTRWVDNPTAYQLEHRRELRRRYEAIGTIAFLSVLHGAVWWFL